MRKILVAVFMVPSFAGLAAAQVPSSGNVFFGDSYYNSKPVVDRRSLNGWKDGSKERSFPTSALSPTSAGTMVHRISQSAQLSLEQSNFATSLGKKTRRQLPSPRRCVVVIGFLSASFYAGF
jgi:hypothetical protein